MTNNKILKQEPQPKGIEITVPGNLKEITIEYLDSLPVYSKNIGFFEAYHFTEERWYPSGVDPPAGATARNYLEEGWKIFLMNPTTEKNKVLYFILIDSVKRGGRRQLFYKGNFFIKNQNINEEENGEV